MQRFDALVVGAGPAGSSTATHLARAGAHVLVADKASFPRDKPCGGGLTGRALKRIPVDPSPVVEQDYGSRELRVTDAEGNQWSFGTYAGEPRRG